MLRILLAGLIALGAPTAAAETLMERGAYLANSVMTCGSCHTPRGPEGPMLDKAFSGGPEFQEPPFTLYGSNITPDPDTGIGRWSDADIKRALTEGLRPDGARLAPIMPYAFYKVLSQRDLDAVVAYLRSIPPIRNQTPPREYRAQGPVELLPGGEKPIEEAARKDKVTQGFYLAAIGRCIGCHTSRMNHAPDFRNGLGRGGLAFEGPWSVSIASNITSSPTKGIGSWSDPEIKRAITQGISRDGRKLKPPERHPARRRREAQPGSCTERENLAGDAKGKGASGFNREAESTDAPARGGLLTPPARLATAAHHGPGGFGCRGPALDGINSPEQVRPAIASVQAAFSLGSLG